MKALFRICVLGALTLGGGTALAAPLDGFVSPAFVFTSVKGVSRSRFELQFGRIQKNVEIDLSAGSGSGYSDFGGVLRVFNHWDLTETDNDSTGVMVGIGAGAYSASKATPRAYVDTVITPFVRGLFDFGMGVGLAVEGGAQFLPVRTYTDNSEPKTDKTARTGFFVGATLMLSSRWLE